MVPLAVMPLNGVGQTYTVLARPHNSLAVGKFVNILKFQVKEIDPGTGEGLGWLAAQRVLCTWDAGHACQW